jgi:tyrosine-specific transport protein
MNGDTRRFLSAIAVLVGTCIGAGVLGIPYVASKSGFFVSLFYIFFIGAIILLVNLYLGEVALRTKGNHQIAGYANKYLGKRGKIVAQIATLFGIYSAIVAYLLGVGASLSFLFFGNFNYIIVFGVSFGILMAGLLHRGMKALKRFERVGVTIILFLLVFIFAWFFRLINFSNLTTFDSNFLFLPFGVVLFALMSFHAVPELKIILNKDRKKLKKALLIGTFVSVVFYALFSFVVVGYMGTNTPEVATLALGPIFIILGVFTMFTSYLALGNALIENLEFDEKMSNFGAWFLTSFIPIILFLLVQYSGLFSFTMILSIGGVVSGGLTAVVVLFIIRSAKKNGDRKPEYSVHVNWFIVLALSLIFILGMVTQFVG